MIDVMAEVVGMLQPAVRYTKIVCAAGLWGVRRADTGQPLYCVVLDGACRIMTKDTPVITLQAGDFVLVPAAGDFTMMGMRLPPARDLNLPPVLLPSGEFRLGRQEGPADVRYIIGHCLFDAPDAMLLVSLLPRLIHVRGDPRLAALVQLLGDESRERRPARAIVMARLVEVLMIEALRSADGVHAAPGLARGLADARLAAALRCMHEAPARSWTVMELAHEAALSRSAFFDRFNKTVGMAPMEYLLTWRMALAKKYLRDGSLRVAEVAERVGYGSASAFSVAFTRHVGVPPARYAHAADAPIDTVIEAL